MPACSGRDLRQRLWLCVLCTVVFPLIVIFYALFQDSRPRNCRTAAYRDCVGGDAGHRRLLHMLVRRDY